MVELGKSYTDSVTGYTGVATARVVYLHEDPRVELEGGPHDGKPVAAKWFTECRLVQATEATSSEADDAPAPQAEPAD